MSRLSANGVIGQNGHKPEALAHASVVAYLVANAERLTRQGAFTKQPAARTVFLHLCCHPGRSSLPRWDMLSSPWDCRVDKDNCDPGVIADATALLRRTVDRALNWLAAEGFIDLERKGTGERRRYGAVTIVATNSSSDGIYRYGHGVLKYPPSPAKGHDVRSKDMVSLTDDSPAAWEPHKAKRTVAGPRPTRGTQAARNRMLRSKPRPLGCGTPRRRRSPRMTCPPSALTPGRRWTCRRHGQQGRPACLQCLHSQRLH